jgi:putative transcriptional regulator
VAEILRAIFIKTSRLDIWPGRWQDRRWKVGFTLTPHVKNRIKEFRSERGWTQQELADKVGVSRQSINSIERNRYVPSLPLALTFSRVFRCSTDELFTLETKP